MEIIESDKRYPVISSATLLWCFSLLYGAVTSIRWWGYEKAVLPSYQLPCTVISVGNLAVGGTGKTPMVMHLARLIEGLGLQVAIISRGYKGLNQSHGAVVSDGSKVKCNARQSGDEPYLMATLLENVPVLVGQDRLAAGKLAIKQFKPDVILLDDAYQHLRLKRDINLLLLDGRRPFGNSYLLPRGRLREPISALSRADAIILTRSGGSSAINSSAIADVKCQIPVFRTVHRSFVRAVAPARESLPPLDAFKGVNIHLKGKKIFAFAGLGDNRSFFNNLSQMGCVFHGSLEYDDHYHYDEDDIEYISNTAIDSRAEYLVTTDKDYVRFSRAFRFPMNVIIMGVEIDFTEDYDPWQLFIKAHIDRL